MEAVPSLCATGTVGIAVIGLAFGHPVHPAATKNRPSKRRVTSTDLSPAARAFHSASTPSPPPNLQLTPSSTLQVQDQSALLSMASKRAPETNKPLPRTPMSNGRNPARHTLIKAHPSSEPTYYSKRKSLQFEPKPNENVKPSLLKSGSTRSSQRSGSPGLTSTPGSATLSQSNSSTAPILTPYSQFNAQIPSRNKLVKRSSSHRVLTGSGNAHLPMRRPATSHQRSATIHQQVQREDTPEDQQVWTPRSDNQLGVSEDLGHRSSHWTPYFKSQSSGSAKDGLQGKRKFGAINHGHDSPSTVTSVQSEPPTLLLASSIDTRPGQSARRPNSEASFLSHASASYEEEPTAPTNSSNAPRNGQAPDARPRTSFSFNDVFPSPSPSTWKIPRTQSFRGRRLLGRRLAGRRVVSAPNPPEQGPFNSSLDGGRSLGNHTHISANTELRGHPAQLPTDHSRVSNRTVSSPLTSVNRLSSFKINLPETIPSYPTTPGRKESPPHSSDRSLLATPSSPLDRFSNKTDSNNFPPTLSQNPKPKGENVNIARSLSIRRFGPGNLVSLENGASQSSSESLGMSSKAPQIETHFDASPLPNFAEDTFMTAEDLEFSKLSIARAENAGASPSHASDGGATTQSHLGQDAAAPLEKADQAKKVTDAEPALIHGDPEALDLRTPTVKASSSDEHLELHSPSAANTLPASRHVSQTSGRAKTGDAAEFRSQKSTPRRRESPPSAGSRLNPFEWSEQNSTERDATRMDTFRPKTVQGRHAVESRGHRLSTRRGPPQLHLRSQSVPVPSENRNHPTNANLDSLTLGKHGPSEDWDGDFDFEDTPRISKAVGEGMRLSLSSGMLVPKSILENQASVHGQFGQVKELTKLVEDLKRLQQQGRNHGLLTGQATELWKEAEGIISLATVDDEEHDFFSSQSPSPEFDIFDEESPSSRRRKSEFSQVRTESQTAGTSENVSTPPGHSSATVTPPSRSRSRKESTATAKSVLEHIHQQRTNHTPPLANVKLTAKKLPFDTTSLKDLVTRAGVVTRALKEEIRRAENRVDSPATSTEVPDRSRPRTPPDPPFSQVFQKPALSQAVSKSSRGPQSPKSPKSSKSSRSSVLGGSMSGNDNDINGHMKVMTVA